MRFMYNIIIKILVATAFLFIVNTTIAQDIRFSQPGNNPLRYNPAMMGANHDLKILLNYRNQWGMIDGGFNTGALTAMYPIYIKKPDWESGNGASKFDVGLVGMYDAAGAFRKIDAAIALGYSHQLTEAHQLSLSGTAGMIQKSLDASNQTFDEQYVWGAFDAANPTGQAILNESVVVPDVGFGLMWHYVPVKEDAKFNAHLGVSGYHINQPNESFVGGLGKLPAKFSFQGALTVLGLQKFDIAFHAIYTMQGSYNQFVGGILGYYNLHEASRSRLLVGGWYKQKEAITLQIGYEHKMFIFGYSYDFATSDISIPIKGLMTHEVSVGFKLNQAKWREAE